MACTIEIANLWGGEPDDQISTALEAKRHGL